MHSTGRPDGPEVEEHGQPLPTIPRWCARIGDLDQPLDGEARGGQAIRVDLQGPMF
jgi:hypothetical protein